MKGGLPMSDLFRRVCVMLMVMALLVTPLAGLAEAPNPTISPNADKYDPEHPEALQQDQLAAVSAILIEESTGDPIFSKNPDAILAPASTTKIMTVLLAIELADGDLSQEVTVSWNAVNLGDPDATTLGLDEGEIIRLDHLLYGTLLRSGNDGAVAIAEHFGGTEANFVAMMNMKAAELHMEKTHFVNAHGLHDPNHYSTASDLAKLAQYAMQNDTFRLIAGTTHYEIPETNTHRARSIETRHRQMLETYKGKENSYYYAPMTGIKSGSHSMAAYCYVGSATKDGVNLISVVLCSGQYDFMRDTKKLFEYGFTQFESVSVSELYAANPVKVYTSGYALNDRDLGELLLSAVPVDPTRSPTLTIRKDEMDWWADHLDDFVLRQWTRDLVAPITAGETVGLMTYVDPHSGEAYEFNLLATRTVPERTDGPPTLEEIVERTENDPNPMPPMTPEIVLIMLLPLIVFVVVIIIIRLIYKQYKRFYSRLPKNRTRYVK